MKMKTIGILLSVYGECETRVNPNITSHRLHLFTCVSSNSLFAERLCFLFIARKRYVVLSCWIANSEFKRFHTLVAGNCNEYVIRLNRQNELGRLATVLAKKLTKCAFHF